MMLRSLMPHQQQALTWAEPRKAIALFMEMRLGKTTTAIRWARHQMDGLAKMGGDAKYLVVAPLTTLAGWVKELYEEGAPIGTVVRLDGMDTLNRDAAVSSGPALVGFPTWYLINYEGIRVWNKALGHHRFDVVILDESTRIKNPRAKTTKVIQAKLSDAPYRCILTGLPNPESLMDYYEQMRFVGGGRFMGHGNFWGWKERFFLDVGYDSVPRKMARKEIRAAVQEMAFFMTRKEAGVGSVLLKEMRTFPMNPEQKRMWRDVKKKFQVGDLQTKSAGAQFVWLQRIAGGFSPDRENPGLVSSAKYDELVRLLDGELKGEPLVVWFNFNEELAYVFHSLRARGFSVAAILGATPVAKRDSRQRRFQRGEVQVLCIQEALGKFGLDLSVADTEVFYSNSFSYETRAQAQDRIIHPKKRTPLLAIDLVTEGTTDEDVVETLTDKNVNARTFNSKLLDRIRQRMA